MHMPQNLLLIPLDDTVVFPTMDVTLPVDTGDEDRVLLVPRHDGEYAKVGTIARVAERVRLPGGARGASLEGIARGVAGAAQATPFGSLRVEVTEHPDDVPVDGRTRELEREYRAVVEEILEIRGDDGRVAAFLRSVSEPGALADTSGYSPDISNEDKQRLLETIDVAERLELALSLQRERLAELQVRRRIRDDVEEGAQAQQREYFLRKQMESIRKELGEDDASVIEEYEKKIGESIARATGREFVRMSLGGVRDEAEIRGHRRTYIGALPGRLVRALKDAKTMNPVIMLDEVDKLGADWRGDPSAALLEVLDPAQNHAFRDHYLDVELDLSHVLFIATANVAESIPGPLLDRMETIRFDGYTVDEKVAIARGYLWPRQVERNGLREDEVAVGDDVLRTVVQEYTREAGVRNLERELGTLLRKTATKLAAAQVTAPVTLDIDAVRDALGRQRFWQEAAERTAVPGVATGLAYTPTGGDVLFIEATSMRGKDDFVLTGQLGDVMKESARIALSYVRGHAEELGIDEDALDGKEFHLHVPAGAIPKDGPSAGITMTTALASLLSGRPVRHTVGMTGEV